MTDHQGPYVLPRGVRIGQIRPRADRPIKNGRWYVARSGWLGKVGWGDLSFEDLELISASTGPEEAFLALPENPPGGQHLPFHPAGAHADVSEPWCWYDRDDDPPGPDIPTLADGAWYAILEGTVYTVDESGEANRLGYVWRERGYRYLSDGRTVSTGKLRLKAIKVEELADRIIAIVGDPHLRSVSAQGQL